MDTSPQSPAVHSFDVFDTLLTRSYATADDVHLHVGEILAARGLVPESAVFVTARRDAERTAWQIEGHSRAISIDVIYRILGATLEWSAAQSHQAMQLEVELEAAGVREVSGMRERLQVSRREGARVCFISDMHLREHHVLAMLERSGLREAGDRVFVSSDIGATKRSRGRLFRHALRELGIGRLQLRHLGDDLRADVLMPALNGVRSSHAPAARLNRFEVAALHHLPPDDWRPRSVVSASKFARLTTPKAPVSAPTWQLLCSTIAPFVTGYAQWLIEQAQRRGIETLFFLARDMQIVCEVAAFLAREQGSNVRCVYLHASRAAWQRPGYTGDLEYDLGWLTDQLERSDARIALQRLLPAQTVVGLEREGVLDQSPSEPVRETLRCWLQSPAVADAVIREVISSRQLLMHYLGASGFAPGARCALVDAGWRGTLQKCLARAYAPLAGNAQIEAFYIGLRHRVPLEPGSAMHAFLPDRQVQQYGYALVSLIEGFLSANHGTTLGYRETNIGGGVEPILGRPPIDALLTQWSTVRESCLVYAREFVASSAFSAQAGILAYALAAPLLTLCTRPTPADAAALRNWRIDVGRDEPRIKALAKSLSAVDIAKLVLARARGTAEGDIYLSGPWLRGSIAASRAPLRQFASLLLPRQDASV